MLCPNCNNPLPDGSKACPMCGMSFVAQPTAQPMFQQPATPPTTIQPQETASQIAAKKELKKKGSEGFMVPILCIFFGLIFLPLAKETHALAFMGLMFIGFGVYLLWKRHRRLKELKLISEGKTQVKICPKCKSPNIEMNVVQASSYTLNQKTTVSKNINPLKPFTHTNINTGNSTTINNYANQCHCLSCGNIFGKPEIIYQ